MYTLVRNNAEELFVEALRLCKNGNIVCPRGQKTLEIPGAVCLELIDTDYNLVTNPYRRLNYAFGIAETLWIHSGRNDLGMLMFYNKNMQAFSDDGETLSGSYGPPFRSQRNYIAQLLSNDRDSRQAVLTIWKPNPRASKDIPCTIALHFLVRDFKLELNVYMRSNDVWLGLPYDIHTFTLLQRQLAVDLGLRPGVYRHIVGSMHMYVSDLYKAEWAIKHKGPTRVAMPTPISGDLTLLSTYEEALRGGRIFETITGSDFFINYYMLLQAYMLKKRPTQFSCSVKFPEPFLSLREASREVQSKIGGSKDEDQADGDVGGIKEK